MDREGSRDEDADVQNAIFAGIKSAAITAFVTSASVVTCVGCSSYSLGKDESEPYRPDTNRVWSVTVHVRSDYRSSNLRNAEEKFSL